MQDDLHRFIWSIVIGFVTIYLLSVVLATLEHRGMVESRSNRLSNPPQVKNEYISIYL